MSSCSMHVHANHPDDLDITASRPSAVSVSQHDSHADVLQQDIDTFGIAGRTWEAAYAMRAYLTLSMPFEPAFPILHDEQRITIIDVGSGTGYLGLALARRLVDQSQPARIVMTDLPEVCPLLERNLASAHLQESSITEVLVRPLPWGDDAALDKLLSETGRPDYVLASDLVYFPFLYPLLLRTLLGLVDSVEMTLVISYKTRTLAREQPFWDAFGAWFEMEPVFLRTDDGWQRFGVQDDIYIFVCHRKRESLARRIPTNDSELMRGATGVNDQFETMLFSEMNPYDDDSEDDD